MSIFKTIGNFISKEVQGAEKTIATIGAYIKKEEPKVQAVVDAAIADYKALMAVEQTPSVISAIEGLKTLIVDLLAL